MTHEWPWRVFVVFITFANIRYQTMIMVLGGQKYSKSSFMDGPPEKHMIRSPVYFFVETSSVIWAQPNCRSSVKQFGPTERSVSH